MFHGLHKVAATTALLLGWVPAVHAASFYLADDAVTIDSDIEAAWDDYKVVTDKEDDSDRVRYCWNPATLAWDEVTSEADCTNLLYDPLGQVDLIDGWFGVNETNMLVAFTTSTPMFSLKNMATDEVISLFDEAVFASGATALPEAFDHKMVFAFDTDPAEGNQTSFDYYMVANIQYDISMQISEADGFLQIYQENGDTDGFQADEDTFMADIDTSDSEVDDDMATAPSNTMEIRQNIETFYDTTGISSGDEVKFRLETHSTDGDTTKAVRVAFTDSNEVTEDAVVVGSGATRFDGRQGDRFPRGVVTAYAQDDQTQLLEFEAYHKKLGVQVAVGDVDGDDELEIVTVPFKKVHNPELKVFDLAGNLEVSAVIPKEADVTRLSRYTVAVGDVDGEAGDEIVLANFAGERVLMDVLQVADDTYTRLAHYDEQIANYGNGAWVDVADVVAENDGEEIVTGSMFSAAVVDLWEYIDGGLNNIVQYDELNVGRKSGVHIAASDGQVVMVKHGGNAKVELQEWVTDKGNLDPTDDTPFSVGVIGDIAYDGTNIAVSSFTRSKVTVYDTAGEKQYTISTNSKGGFVEFVSL
ncbi:MAG: hypothetical protein HY565_00640 [Candidatus Kerfeldbacteria bacterium]|nr:hypothetical protein [Candidatus Kerfeldbacteria bacterium]